MTAGIIPATLLITATTIDDAVWLLPYCTSPQLPNFTKIVHGITFILTLEFLAILCVFVSYIFQGFLLVHYKSSGVDEGFVLGSAGAIICWAIAIGLYIKKMLKRRQRAMAATTKTNSEEHLEDNSLLRNKDKENSAAIEAGEDVDSSSDDDNDSQGRDVSATPSVWMIMSLTTLGALDEISYFPALLVGNVFSPSELCIGTLLASGIILVIVLMFLSKFKPLVDFLDSIPLYGIVGIFAVILTAGLFVGK